MNEDQDVPRSSPTLQGAWASQDPLLPTDF